jgi:hypothetical protein
VGTKSKAESAGAALVAQRYAKMTPEERSEAARNAAKAKWEQWRTEHPEKAKKAGKKKGNFTRRKS